MVLACTILLVSRECGGCGSSRLPGGKPAVETLADYIEGKVEFETISSILFFACETAISGDKMSLLRHHLAYQGETAEFGTLFDSPHTEPGASSTEATAS